MIHWADLHCCVQNPPNSKINFGREIFCIGKVNILIWDTMMFSLLTLNFLESVV